MSIEPFHLSRIFPLSHISTLYDNVFLSPCDTFFIYHNINFFITHPEKSSAKNKPFIGTSPNKKAHFILLSGSITVQI